MNLCGVFMNKFLEILKEINDIPLVSSREEIFIPKLQDKLTQWLPDYKIQNIDNNLVVIPNTNVNNLLISHVDEIGFLIKRQINENTYELQTCGLLNKSHGTKVQTLKDEKKYTGIIGNILPHSGETIDKLVVEFSENVNLPPMWPVQFINEPVFGNYVLSKTLDNHCAAASLINVALQKNIAFILTTGEEEGTQRLIYLMKNLPVEYDDTIVIDAAPSNQDSYYKEKTMIDEGNLGIMPEEGAGNGNKAPSELIEKIKNYATQNNIKLNTIETRYPDEITDATNLYKIGIKCISVCYPIRYLHNSMEVMNIETIKILEKFLLNI